MFIPWIEAAQGNSPPYIVAEISGSHRGSIYRAKELIEHAKQVGADAVKFQAYTPDTITINHDGAGFIMHGGQWNGRKLYDLYKEAHTPFEWFPALFEHARHIGITPFSSVFDPTSVDMLEGLGCEFYKIASFEITDIPLIKKVVSTGKPVILSTGMASDRDISEADNVIPPEYPHIFLHCVSGYPAPLDELDLGGIKRLQAQLHLPVGFSDHTLGCDGAIAATAMGAVLLEKHLVLRRDGGPDDAFSMEPHEFDEYVRRVKAIWAGTLHRSRVSESPQMTARRSLYVVKEIAAGEAISSENVRSIRPAYGLPPKFWGAVAGRHAKHVLPFGTPLSLDDLSD